MFEISFAVIRSTKIRNPQTKQQFLTNMFADRCLQFYDINPVPSKVQNLRK